MAPGPHLCRILGDHLAGAHWAWTSESLHTARRSSLGHRMRELQDTGWSSPGDQCGYVNRIIGVIMWEVRKELNGTLDGIFGCSSPIFKIINKSIVYFSYVGGQYMN